MLMYDLKKQSHVHKHVMQNTFMHSPWTAAAWCSSNDVRTKAPQHRPLSQSLLLGLGAPFAALHEHVIPFLQAHVHRGGQTIMPDASSTLHQLAQPAPAASYGLQNVEIGIPADSQVAVACGYMTRAKQSLAHVTLDELEQTLPLPPDETFLPLEDGEEYQYFLHVSTVVPMKILQH